MQIPKCDDGTWDFACRGYMPGLFSKEIGPVES